jgi:hypothetical protein
MLSRVWITMLNLMFTIGLTCLEAMVGLLDVT